MFFLHIIFERTLSEKLRIDITKLLKNKIDEVNPIVGVFIPI